MKFAESLKIPIFREVSAKTGINVHEVFNLLAEEAWVYKNEIQFFKTYDLINKSCVEEMMKEEESQRTFFQDICTLS